MFYVSATANDTNMGTVRGSGEYAENAVISIEAIPHADYHFVKWTDGDTVNPRTVTLTQDTVFIAEFDTNRYNVTLLVNDSVRGSVSGSGEYVKNTVVSIRAIPNTGYRFMSWNDGDNQNPRTITVTENIRLTATFAVSATGMFYVSVVANNPNMGTVTGSGDYKQDTVITITAIPNAGYRFVNWNDNNTDNPRSITIIQDTTFTAIFEEIKYNVSLSANDASRGTLTGNGVYPLNNAAKITATPNTGYRFVFWNDGNTDSVRIITVTQNITLVAIFGIEDMYYVYAVPNNPTMGSVTGSDDYHKSNGQNSPIFKREYAVNTVALITAVPNAGYRFVRWNDGNTDNPREFTVVGDSIFKAIFDVATAIANIETSTITVYPNPATDNIHITLPDNIHQAIFTLYDMQGKILLQQEIDTQDAVSVSKLAAGIYIYNIITNTQTHTGKLIINN
jgi:hypothetical protein